MLKKGAIEKITEIAVTDDMSKRAAMRYAASVYDAVKPEHTGNKYTIDGKEIGSPFEVAINPFAVEIEEQYTMVEDKRHREIHREYAKVADKRLAVCEFLSEFRRSRSGILQFFSDAPTRRERNFEFEKRGLIGQRENCNCQIVSFSDINGKNTFEVVIKIGEEEIRQKFEFESEFDNPISILEFAEFLYGESGLEHEDRRVKSEMGNVFLRHAQKADRPQFGRKCRKLAELFQVAMSEFKVGGMGFYDIEDGKLHEIARQLNEKWRLRDEVRFRPRTVSMSGERSGVEEQIDDIIGDDQEIK